MAGRVRSLITLVVLGALFVPAVLDRDDFPLSTYPMYAQTRGEVVSLVIAHGVDGDGARVALSMDILARTDDPLIAASALRQGAASDADALCRSIGQRMVADDLAGVVAVRVLRETHDVVQRSQGRASLRTSETLADCAVDE